MDALLLVDTTRDHLPSPPPPLVDLVDRVRGVGGVIVHVAERAVESGGAGEQAADRAAEGVAEHARAPERTEDVEDGDLEVGDLQPQIDSAVGTTEDELVLVSGSPDAFEGVEDLAEGLDDLGVDRIIVAGSNARGGLLESSAAALAIGFELTVVRDGLDDSGEWVAQLEASGAVVKDGADVWLKM